MKKSELVARIAARLSIPRTTADASVRPAFSSKERLRTDFATLQAPITAPPPNLYALKDGTARPEYSTTRVLVSAEGCQRFSTMMARRSSFTRTLTFT